jgi:branched-chain amino acid transport system ATP-binding protein
MTPLLEVEGLAKRYGGVVATAGVSFDVTPGEIVGVIGPNGAGKTTLFDLVSGYARPDKGRVRFAGEDITGWRPDRISRSGLGRTFQRLRPFPDLTFLENAMVGALAHTAKLARARAEARHWLDVVGLGAQADKKAFTASTGQRRRIELARVLATRPRLLLLDEPTAGVDPGAVEAMGALLRDVRERQGMTLVVVEHDLPFITSLADRIVALHLGEKLCDGRPDTVTGDARVITAYLGG